MMRLIILLFITLPTLLLAQNQLKHTYIVSFDIQPMSKLQSYSDHDSNNENLKSTHLHRITSQQDDALNKLNQQFQKTFKSHFRYTQALNGLSLELTEQEAEFMAGLTEVTAITKETYLQTTTDATASMVKADDIWGGFNINPFSESQGEDIVIGVLDTGINLGHESFSDIPEDNYDFASHNPNGADTFIGWCDPNHPNYDVSYVCNNKIIGAWDFVEATNGSSENDGPLDNNFHGSHMSGIISGNHISAPPGGFVFSFGGGVLNAPFISGIAPHSHVIMYDVCDIRNNSVVCPSSAVLAAIDQAIIDEVDVINLSLSGESNPWAQNSISLALLNASNMGIISSTSAGNATSQQPNTYARVTNLAPWVMTAANSYHGRTQSNDVSVISMMPVPDILIGMYSVISNAVALVMDIQSPIVYSKDIDDNNEKGCLTWNPLDFDGSVALIKSGDCSNEMKVQNAQDAGALAVIIFNADSDLPELMSGINSPTIPATMIGLADANNVINYIHENAPEPSAIEILAETTHKIVDALGMVLYHSSLRGPNNNFNITKPDITAPGSHVFAAIAELGQPAPQYYTATGTSQSTAVISGSMALIKSLRPNLSPSEIKSVMMLSANNSIVFDNGNNTNPDDIGSGMLDLVKAVNTPLVMDENLENYTNANPAIGGLAETLNIASLRNNSCANGCRWTRTLTNKSDNVHSWTISANTDSGSEIAISGIAISGDNLPIENISTLGFNLVPEQSISLEIEYRLLSGPVNEYRFATITFTSTQETVPQSQLSMVVYLDDFIFNNGFE